MDIQNTRFRRSTRQVSTRLGEDTVVLHLEAEEYFQLNEVGSRIWELLETPRTVEELATQLHKEFEVSPQQLRTDLVAFLQRLLELDLVEVVSDGETDPPQDA